VFDQDLVDSERVYEGHLDVASINQATGLESKSPEVSVFCIPKAEQSVIATPVEDLFFNGVIHASERQDGNSVNQHEDGQVY